MTIPDPHAVTFVHLTDLHIGHPERPDPHLHSDTAETLREVLRMVARIEPKPRFIVASGDLTNAGDVGSYRRLKQILADIDIPVLFALGNHDTRPGFYEGIMDRSEDVDAPYDHDRVIDAIHVIVLDSSEPGRIAGTLTPEQFVRLEQALDRHPELPKLIVSHHPPALGTTPDWARWRTLDFDQSQRLAALLMGRDILGILSGHIHHDRVSFWHGVPVIVGTGQHAATDILSSSDLRMVQGASFGLCTVRPSGLTVAFVPLPSDRHELARIPYDRLIAIDDIPKAAAAE